MSQPTVFISYSSADEREKEALLAHLGGLQQAGLIKTWSDDQISAGADWQKAIQQAIAQTRVAILLITANFLSSEFIMEREIPTLISRQQKGELVIFPIIARACAWKEIAWLQKLKVRPQHGLPIWRNGGSHADEELSAIAEEIARLVKAPAQPPNQAKTARQPSQTLFRPGGPAPNPFGDKGRITDPGRFFDRNGLLRQVFEELAKGVNLSLVGESQTGKSSILSMICILGPEQLPNVFDRIAYLNLEWVDDENDFYDALCDALGLAAGRGFKLTRALQGKSYLLCLDEIEKMTWDGFTMRLRSHLRGLADGRDAPLKLVIASRSPLSRLFADSPEMNSPLAGICHQLDVRPFAPNISRTFLMHRLQGTGITFTDSQIEALIAENQGYPARLQQAAAKLYQALTQQAVAQRL
jgi:hypothetical protein